MLKIIGEDVSNFYRFINHVSVEIEKISEEQAIDVLSFYLNETTLNDNSFDPLNYELIWFIEDKFYDHPQIQAMIHDIKGAVVRNYIYRQKLMRRHVLMID